MYYTLSLFFSSQLRWQHYNWIGVLPDCCNHIAILLKFNVIWWSQSLPCYWFQLIFLLLRSDINAIIHQLSKKWYTTKKVVYIHSVVLICKVLVSLVTTLIQIWLYFPAFLCNTPAGTHIHSHCCPNPHTEAMLCWFHWHVLVHRTPPLECYHCFIYQLNHDCPFYRLAGQQRSLDESIVVRV